MVDQKIKHKCPKNSMINKPKENLNNRDGFTEQSSIYFYHAIYSYKFKRFYDPVKTSH